MSLSECRVCSDHDDINILPTPVEDVVLLRQSSINGFLTSNGNMTPPIAVILPHREDVRCYEVEGADPLGEQMNRNDNDAGFGCAALIGRGGLTGIVCLGTGASVKGFGGRLL